MRGVLCPVWLFFLFLSFCSTLINVCTTRVDITFSIFFFFLKATDEAPLFLKKNKKKTFALLYRSLISSCINEPF